MYGHHVRKHPGIPFVVAEFKPEEEDPLKKSRLARAAQLKLRKALRKEKQAAVRRAAGAAKQATIQEERARLAEKARRLRLSEPSMLQAIRAGTACFLCGATMTNGHMAKHGHLKDSISSAKRPAVNNSDPASVWAVSGGLPSLGKRAR